MDPDDPDWDAYAPAGGWATLLNTMHTEEDAPAGPSGVVVWPNPDTPEPEPEPAAGPSMHLVASNAVGDWQRVSTESDAQLPEPLAPDPTNIHAENWHPSLYTYASWRGIREMDADGSMWRLMREIRQPPPHGIPAGRYHAFLAGLGMRPAGRLTTGAIGCVRKAIRHQPYHLRTSVAKQGDRSVGDLTKAARVAGARYVHPSPLCTLASVLAAHILVVRATGYGRLYSPLPAQRPTDVQTPGEVRDIALDGRLVVIVYDGHFYDHCVDA